MKTNRLFLAVTLLVAATAVFAGCGRNSNSSSENAPAPAKPPAQQPAANPAAANAANSSTTTNLIKTNTPD